MDSISNKSPLIFSIFSKDNLSIDSIIFSGISLNFFLKSLAMFNNSVDNMLLFKTHYSYDGCHLKLIIHGSITLKLHI